MIVAGSSDRVQRGEGSYKNVTRFMQPEQRENWWRVLIRSGEIAGAFLYFGAVIAMLNGFAVMAMWFFG